MRARLLISTRVCAVFQTVSALLAAAARSTRGSASLHFLSFPPDNDECVRARLNSGVIYSRAAECQTHSPRRELGCIRLHHLTQNVSVIYHSWKVVHGHPVLPRSRLTGMPGFIWKEESVRCLVKVSLERFELYNIERRQPEPVAASVIPPSQWREGNGRKMAHFSRSTDTCL